MDLKSCHLCRPQHLEPRAAIVVDIMTEGLVSDFHGLFDVVLLTAPSREEDAKILPARLQFHVQQVWRFLCLFVFIIVVVLPRII